MPLGVLQAQRWLFTRIASATPGARMVKSGVAVALVWAVGQALGQERPMFAVFAALGAIQPTVRASTIHLGGMLAGVLVGSILALAMASAFGAPQAATLGVAVVIALALGSRLAPLPSSLGSEVLGTTILTVVFANGQSGWIAERLCEIAGGGAIALMVNALVLPPDYLADVKRAVQQLADELAQGMRQAIDDLVHQPSPDDVRAHLVAARAGRKNADVLVAATSKALEALRFSPILRINPLRRGHAARVERCAAAVHTLAGALDHVRTAQRAAWQATRRPAQDEVERAVWLPLGDALVQAIRAFEAHATAGDTASRERAVGALRHAVDVHTQALARHAAMPSTVWAVDRSAILSEIEHVLEDLAEPLKVDLPNTTAATRPVPSLQLAAAR